MYTRIPSNSTANSPSQTISPHPRQRSHPRSDASASSRLSFNDRAFIEFTRCLHQAKAIVKELESFSASICPAVRISVYEPTALHHDPRLGSEVFIQQVNTYLGDTFQKFSRLCKILLMVLTKMQNSQQVKPERIESFRSEVWEEWRIATEIKQNLVSYIQQHVNQFSQPQPQPQPQIQPSRSNTTTTTTTTTTTSTTTSTTITRGEEGGGIGGGSVRGGDGGNEDGSTSTSGIGVNDGNDGAGARVGGVGGVGGGGGGALSAESIAEYPQNTFINNTPFI